MATYFSLVAGVRKLLTAVVASAGVADADKLVALGSSGKLDPSVLNVGTAANTVAAGNHLHTGVYEATGTVAAHTNAIDPHTQYHTDARGDSRYLRLTGGTVSGDITVNGITCNTSQGFGSRLGQHISLYGSLFGLGIQSGTLYLRTYNFLSFHIGGVHSDTAFAPGTGGTEIVRIAPNGINLGPDNAGNSSTAWFRSYGNTGWYNGTYGGGWHMTDTTFIRNYADKCLHLNRDWDVVYGNLFLRGNAPSIVMFETDTSSKWLMHCNEGNLVFYKTITNAEGAGDWITKAVLLSSGTYQLPALAGSGNRAVYSDASGVLTNTSSDRRLKTSITPIRYGLADVLRLAPVSFRWKNPQLGGQTEIGLIAQDVQAIIPEVIGRNADDMLSIDYPKLVAVLINAIKDLNARIQILEARP